MVSSLEQSQADMEEEETTEVPQANDPPEEAKPTPGAPEPEEPEYSESVPLMNIM